MDALSDRPRHTSADAVPPPLVDATALALKGPRGRVFGPIDLDLPAGAAVALVGRAGCGKSSLLLALTGRMRGVTGELSVAGRDAMRHGRLVRKLSSVARIDGLVEAEDALSLEDCITERTLADAGSARGRLANYLHVAQLVGLDAPRSTQFGLLPPADQIRACLALASIRPAPLIVLDDIDRETTLSEQAELWGALLKLAADGVAVVASTSERASIPPGVITIEMDTTNA